MRGVVILVNGASATGKSRLIREIQLISRESGVLRELYVAQRYTTRKPRENESLPGENCYMEDSEFEAAVHSGFLDVHWRRAISAQQEIRYGFALHRDLAAGGIVVLSGNNYLAWQTDSWLRALRAKQRLMVVRILASQSTRLARLGSRLPRPTRTELASRMKDLPAQLLPPADYAIPNDPQFQAFAEWEFLRLAASFWFQDRNDHGRLSA